VLNYGALVPFRSKHINENSVKNVKYFGNFLKWYLLFEINRVITVIQLNLSSTATLRTEEGSHCREVETRVNVWTARQKILPLYWGDCGGEVAGSGGLTVQITW